MKTLLTDARTWALYLLCANEWRAFVTLLTTHANERRWAVVTFLLAALILVTLGLCAQSPAQLGAVGLGIAGLLFIAVDFAKGDVEP